MRKAWLCLNIGFDGSNRAKPKKKNQTAVLFFIHCCCPGSEHETETTLGILSRKGLNVGNQVLPNNWNGCRMESRVEVTELEGTTSELQSGIRKPLSLPQAPPDSHEAGAWALECQVGLPPLGPHSQMFRTLHLPAQTAKERRPLLTSIL